ncbi:protein pangolin, isoforms A/H/I/S isoform X3 [Diabrotica undecimpunctata]|uniref:protein pangolin, isoforms A/H/I/S isoform X3 n=1 Tax=Diabrotica undecimpunctata TaxID=50387 RepID=UPI003B63E404
MPHVSSSGGDDLGSTDEVKVFKDEGDGEDEKRSSENLTEEKSSLIDLTESEEKSGTGNYHPTSKHVQRPDHSPVFGKVEPTPHTSSFNMGYLVSPYSYANGAGGPIPVSMAGKMGLGPTGHMPFFCHNGDPLSQPPPAHMGIPPYQLDSKGAASMGLTRPPMYPFSAGQYPYPMLSPEMSQVASWHTPSMYPLSPGAGFRSPYPSTLPISTSSLPSDFYRFSPTGLIQPHPGLSPHPPHLSSHPAIVTPGPKQELPDLNHRSQVDHKNNIDGKNNQDSNEKKKPHIKKPLNAFMLYMKEMRAKVVAECTLKESAAINQILGRRWHSLSREEQAKYYEKARQERQLHMQLYPGWSARDNYGYGTKKKKRKKERTPIESGGNSMKKCRARYGLDQQSQWCKPCRRKKKCIRYMEAGDGNDGNQSDDNLGSCGSMGDAHTPPDDDNESLNQSMSSPGGLSALSSLTSPGGMVLPSPSTSVASPSVSVASPYMLQSPLTPHELLDVKVPLPPVSHQHQPTRNPVGTNPHDINNPLSVNQLTGQCVRNDNSDANGNKETRSIISVT